MVSPHLMYQPSHVRYTELRKLAIQQRIHRTYFYCECFMSYNINLDPTSALVLREYPCVSDTNHCQTHKPGVTSRAVSGSHRRRPRNPLKHAYIRRETRQTDTHPKLPLPSRVCCARVWTQPYSPDWRLRKRLLQHGKVFQGRGVGTTS